MAKEQSARYALIRAVVNYKEFAEAVDYIKAKQLPSDNMRALLKELDILKKAVVEASAALKDEHELTVVPTTES